MVAIVAGLPRRLVSAEALPWDPAVGSKLDTREALEPNPQSPVRAVPGIFYF